MIETILELTTFNDSGSPLSIKVTAEDSTGVQGGAQVNLLKVTLIADGDPVGVISFDPANGTLQITDMSVSVVGYTSCLVACGLGHIVSDILDCRRRGKTSVRDLIACLKKKGHRLALNLINCAVACCQLQWPREPKAGLAADQKPTKGVRHVFNSL